MIEKQDHKIHENSNLTIQNQLNKILKLYKNEKRNKLEIIKVKMIWLDNRELIELRKETENKDNILETGSKKIAAA